MLPGADGANGPLEMKRVGEGDENAVDVGVVKNF